MSESQQRLKRKYGLHRQQLMTEHEKRQLAYMFRRRTLFLAVQRALREL